MSKPLQARPLSLRVVNALDASVSEGQKLRQGQSAIAKSNGFIRFELDPYRSIRVEAWSCTKVMVEQLQPFGSGVAFKVGYGNILFCPYKAYLKITSTLKSPQSGAKASANGRQITLRGTELAVSQGRNNETLIGVSRGFADVGYLNSDQSITPGYYLRSVDGQALPAPIWAGTPALESVATLPNGIHRVCTKGDRKLISKLGRIPVYLGEKLCLDTTLDDEMTELLPTGSGQNWRFDTNGDSVSK